LHRTHSADVAFDLSALRTTHACLINQFEQTGHRRPDADRGLPYQIEHSLGCLLARPVDDCRHPLLIVRPGASRAKLRDFTADPLEAESRITGTLGGNRIRAITRTVRLEGTRFGTRVERLPDVASNLASAFFCGPPPSQMDCPSVN
jgi:hypothetical protein